MDRIQLLCDISNAFGPSGFEDDVVAVARHYAPPGALLHEDTTRNLYISRQQDTGSGKPVVLLDAHSDEVGFMVQAIKPNGLLAIAPLGGWSGNTIPAHTVVIKNRDGQLVPGIITSKPPHYGGTDSTDITSMFIDVGATSAAEVTEYFHIGLGAPVAPDTRFAYNPGNGVMMGKAFDCRAGCACVLDVMHQLAAQELAVAPVGVLTAQEEVGTRGAKIAAEVVKPAVAIAFEGCPADDTFAEGWAAQTVMKKGPMLRHYDRTMITNPRFQRFALDVAQAAGIPVQEGVRTGGGTNGGAYHLSGAGIPTIVIGVPVRYIHTHYGYAAREDVDSSIALGLEIIRRLTPEVLAGF